MAICIACGTEFAAKRSTAKYCSERCKSRAKRLRAGYPAEVSGPASPEFGVAISDADAAITRAVELAEDMSRLACKLPDPPAGSLERVSEAISEALRKEDAI